MPSHREYCVSRRVNLSANIDLLSPAGLPRRYQISTPFDFCNQQEA